MGYLKKGIYKHFKGKEILVIDTTEHGVVDDEGLKQFVVVYQLLKDKSFRVMPVKDFCGSVEVNGIQIPRFTFEKEVDLHISLDDINEFIK